MNTPKPAHLGPGYAEIFRDASVVGAYRHRPPYPVEVFEILAGLVASPHVVLDAGCGSGDLAIPLAPLVARIDAVDPSAAMLAAARARPGGSHSGIRWILGPMESAPLDPPYGIVTAAESLHWMEWRVVLPRFREALVPDGLLAIVEREELLNGWKAELEPLYREHGTNREWRPYDVVDEVMTRDLFERLGSTRTAPVPFVQSIDDYIESIHSRNGFSRDRMTAKSQQAFDAATREVLRGYAPDGLLHFEVAGVVTWGRPAPHTRLRSEAILGG